MGERRSTSEAINPGDLHQVCRSDKFAVQNSSPKFISAKRNQTEEKPSAALIFRSFPII